MEQEGVGKRLYYEDARLLTFTARILEEQELSPVEAGPRTDAEGRALGRCPAVRLDQTAFYPTSGGQPHDTGRLGGVRVVEVLEDDAGEIWHLLEAPLGRSGEVSGTVDGARRFDHMQQHTGQHLLSASFEALMSARTVSFHLGSEASTIDLEIEDLSWDAAHRIEQAVNTVVWENRAVAVQVLAPQQLDDAESYLGCSLRKPPAVTGDVRVILVDGYDASACGGTHVSGTGEIGLIKIAGIERYKGGVRVSFLCGGRALRDYQQVQQLLQVSSLTLSVGREELPEAIARLGEKERAARKEARQLQAALSEVEAASLWRTAPVVRGVRVILVYDDAKSAADARALAGRLRERDGTLVLLAAAGGASDGAKGMHLLVARSDDLSDLDAAVMLRDIAERLGGRGGGSPFLAQGGAPPHPAEQVLEVFRVVLAHGSIDLAP